MIYLENIRYQLFLFAPCTNSYLNLYEWKEDDKTDVLIISLIRVRRWLAKVNHYFRRTRVDELSNNATFSIVSDRKLVALPVHRIPLTPLTSF